MITISLTTIIAGAAVVILAILGSLINPFLRSLRFPKEALSTESAEEKKPVPPITVLITAHDNEEELKRNLPMFLRQQYAADYQVIVVCQSTDGDTIDYLKRTATENPHLYYTYIPESSRYMSRKKLQITLGVKAAKYEWIILTEPTCKPENDKWLATMAHQCQEPRICNIRRRDQGSTQIRKHPQGVLPIAPCPTLVWLSYPYAKCSFS